MGNVNITMKSLFSSLLISINVVVLILLLLPLMNIDLWWVDNLANLQWQWSICGILLMLLNSVFKLPFKYLLITLLALVISYQQWFLFKPQQAFNSALYSNETLTFNRVKTLTIAQFNISYNNQHLHELLSQLGDPDFDIIVLQEASDKQGNNINILTQYYPYSLGLETLNGTPSGLVVFSRWPIIENKIHALADVNTHILELVVQSPESQMPIQIYAIHPVSPRSKGLWQKRNETFDYLGELVSDSLLTHKVIIGDFNSSPWTAAFARLEQQTALKNSAAGFGYIPSWSLREQHQFWPVLSAYVDHCLVSEELAVINKQQHQLAGSDHLLIQTTLALP